MHSPVSEPTFRSNQPDCEGSHMATAPGRFRHEREDGLSRRAIGIGRPLAAGLSLLALTMAGCASAQSPDGTFAAPPTADGPVDSNPRPPKGPYLDNMPTVDGDVVPKAKRKPSVPGPTEEPGVSGGTASTGGAGNN